MIKHQPNGVRVFAEECENLNFTDCQKAFNSIQSCACSSSSKKSPICNTGRMSIEALVQTPKLAAARIYHNSLPTNMVQKTL